MATAELPVRVRRETVAAFELFHRLKRTAGQQPLAWQFANPRTPSMSVFELAEHGGTKPAMPPTAQCIQGLISRSGWGTDSTGEIPYQYCGLRPQQFYSEEPPF